MRNKRIVEHLGAGVVVALVISVLSISNANDAAPKKDGEGVEDQAAIKELFKQREKTFNARDLAAQLKLVDDDVSLVTAVGQWTVHGKEEYAALMLFIWDGLFKGVTLTEEVQRIDFVADGVAVVHLELDFTPSERFPYDSLTAHRIVVKKNGKWLWRSSAHVPHRRDPPLTLEGFAKAIDAKREEARGYLSKEKK